MPIAKMLLRKYKKILFTRRDDDGSIFYFKYTDFPGLNREEYSFENKFGHTLRGYMYFYDSPIQNRIIVFDHGMGVGHRAYMREIEMLAKHGYAVYSYDHTGCTESGGDHIMGLCGSLSDLDDCLSSLKAQKELYDVDFSVVGHSWGGYSSMNILKFHPDVKSVVAISGFTSLDVMQRQAIPPIVGRYRTRMYELEKNIHPRYADSSAVEVLGGTDTPVLLIHSLDDPTVSAKENHIKLQYELKGKKNIKFLLLNGKGHNPNYTEDAVRLRKKFFKELKKRRKNGTLTTDEEKAAFLSDYDWHKITEQDNSVWSEIFDFLDE